MKNNYHVSVFELSDTPLDCNESSNDKPYYIPHSVIFLKSTAAPWNRYFGKTHSKTYVFNYKTNAKEYDFNRPRSAEANFIETFKKRIIWYWPYDESLTMTMLADFIKDKLPVYNYDIKY